MGPRFSFSGGQIVLSASFYSVGYSTSRKSFIPLFCIQEYCKMCEDIFICQEDWGGEVRASSIWCLRAGNINCPVVC